MIRDADYLARLRSVGSQPLLLSGAEFGASMARYNAKVRELVRLLAITPT